MIQRKRARMANVLLQAGAKMRDPYGNIWVLRLSAGCTVGDITMRESRYILLAPRGVVRVNLLPIPQGAWNCALLNRELIRSIRNNV